LFSNVLGCQRVHPPPDITLTTAAVYTSSTEEAKLAPMGRELTQVEEELEIVSTTIPQKVRLSLVIVFTLL